MVGDPTGLPSMEPPQLKSLPPLHQEGDADTQLGFDEFDSMDEQAEVLIRVSTEALEGEDDLIDEGDEIEEPAEAEAVPEPAADLAAMPKVEPPAEVAPEAVAQVADLAAMPEVEPPAEVAPEAVAQVADLAAMPEVEPPAEVAPEAVAQAVDVADVVAMYEFEPVAEPVAPPEVERAGEPLVMVDLVEEPEAQGVEVADEALEDEGPARPQPYEPAAQQPADDWALQIRLARIHLKTGAFVMARAELEALVARDKLDTPAHLDLAEVRWRTGDLHGAGEAASAYMAAGGDDALGYVIAAEACAMANRHGEARRYAEQALQRHLSELDPIFAGIPRKATWNTGAWGTAPALEVPIAMPAAPVVPLETAASAEPNVTAPEPEVAAREASIAAREASVAAREATVTAREDAAVPEVAAEGAPEVADEIAPEAVAPEPMVAAEIAPEPQPVEPEGTAAPTPAASPQPTANGAEAGAEVESGRTFLAAGDPLMAALHFSVAVRLAPDSATAVLDAIGDRQDLALQLVRGDALRLLGQEGDAGKAYLSVANALGAPRPAAPEATPDVPAEPEKPAAAKSGKSGKSATSESATASVEAEPPAGPAGDDLPPIRWD
jgi:tetratricopeptide (TPR) repeat protein